MKTYKAKSSVNRAVKSLMVKHPEIISFEARQLIASKEWCIYVELNTPEISPELKAIVNQYKLAPAPAKAKKEPNVATEEKVVKVKHQKALTPERRESKADNPCKLVWDIAEEMLAEGKKRKDIIAECEKQGVAYYTARTQYQKYQAAVKASA